MPEGNCVSHGQGMGEPEPAGAVGSAYGAIFDRSLLMGSDLYLKVVRQCITNMFPPCFLQCGTFHLYFVH